MALGPNSATCAGLVHGRDYSSCIVSEQKLQKGLGHCSSSGLQLSKILENQWLTLGFFQPSTPN